MEPIEPKPEKIFNPTDAELRKLVGVLGVKPESINKAFTNKMILTRLRHLDYSGRKKLSLLMLGLLDEQDSERQGFCEKLSGLVGLIDQIEAEYQGDNFRSRLDNAVHSLSLDEQKKLLNRLENKSKDTE